MKDEYIIINKSQIEKRISKLLKYVGNRKPNADEYAKMQVYKQILSQSTPLIPEIEKAFDAGSKSGSQNWDSWTAPNIKLDKQHYISNLKLDI